MVSKLTEDIQRKKKKYSVDKLGHIDVFEVYAPYKCDISPPSCCFSVVLRMPAELVTITNENNY